MKPASVVGVKGVLIKEDVARIFRVGGVPAGFRTMDGENINGVAAYDWNDFVALSAPDLALLGDMPVRVKNKYNNASGVGGLFFIRDETPGGWAQISGPLYAPNVSDFPPAASWEGLRCFATAVGLHGTKYRSDGDIYVMDQESALVGRRVTPSKAIILPTQGWTVSSVNTSDLAAGLLRLVGAGTHGLTAAQTTTPTDGTWVEVTAGTGWTPGLYKINSVTDSTSNIIIEAPSTANVPTVTSANAGGSSSPVIDTITIPPMNKYGELEVDLTVGFTSTGGTTFFVTPKIAYDSFLMLACAPAVNTVAGSYTYRADSVLMRNQNSVNSQRGSAPKLSNSQDGLSNITYGIQISGLPDVGTVNSGVAQTLKIGVGSSIANQRCWLDSYTVRMRG